MSFLTRISFRNRKGRLTIYGLVLLEVVAISFIIPSSSSTGEVFIDTDAVFQSGAAQCTLRQNPPNQEPPGCNGVITFPVAFASIPTKYGITVSCFSNSNQTLTGKTADQVCQGLGIQQGHDVTAVFNAITVEADNGQTWTSMPAATTELYGTVNHESIGYWQGISRVALSVNILTTSVGANATLRVQCFDTIGGVFVDIPQAFVEVDVFPGPTSSVLGSNNVPKNCQNAPETIRIVGQNGAGVGDNPSFNEIQVSYSTSIPVVVDPVIGCQFGGQVCVSKTSMTFQVTAINPANALGFGVPIFAWWACAC